MNKEQKLLLAECYFAAIVVTIFVVTVFVAILSMSALGMIICDLFATWLNVRFMYEVAEERKKLKERNHA